MNLNFISSEILKSYDYNKHFGLFVYLTKDYKEYAYGLYFGGINGWERLTNDSYFTKRNVNVPIASSIVYTYNGKSQTYVPANWSEIKGLTSIFNDTAIDAGTYNVEVSLADTNGYQWADGKIDTKILKWIINPYSLASDQIKANLNKYEMTYGDDEPYVSSVICSHVFSGNGNVGNKVLSENTDYLVTKPSDFNVGTKQFKVSLTGNFGKNYTCDDIYLKVKVNKKKIAEPTNLYQEVAYDSDNVKVYNPKPDNWSEISSYCTITGQKDVKNVGTYTYTIALKDKNNYCWSDESSDDKTLTFVISTEGVEVPDWSNLSNAYEYQTSFKTTPINLNPKNYANIVEDVVISGSIEEVSKPGTYTITISLEDSENQNWNDGSKDSKEFTVVINSHVVAHPTFNSTLTYNGKEQSYLPSNWSSISGDCSISGNKQTNAGTYEYKISLNDNDGFIWDDTKNNSDKSGKWTINKAKVAIPTKPNITYTYNGNTQTWEPTNWSSISNYCNISGNKQTNAGTYHPIVSLKDTNNYIWSDNTSEDMKFNWIINRFTHSAAILEPNETDLTKSSDGHYTMTYNPTNHPKVKVTSSNGTNVLTEGTDYDVTYPTSYNASETEYQYTIVMKGNYTGTYNLYLKVNKAAGYFISGPSISGDLKYGETISVVAEPVENAEMTYQWYSDVAPLTETGSGDVESELTSSSIKLEYTDYYYGVVVHAAETTNYLAHDGYAYTTSVVGKGEYAFSLNEHEGRIAFKENGIFTMPGNNKKTDDDGTVTYTISDATVATIQSQTDGKIAMKSVGEVKITAKISGGTRYDYTNDTDTFVLTITDKSPAYYGYSPYLNYAVYEYTEKHSGERLTDSLKNGVLPNNKEVVELTDDTDGTTFTMNGSDWYKKYNENCRCWWFAVPKSSILKSVIDTGVETVSGVKESDLLKNEDVFENGDTDDSEFVINIGGADYYIYAPIGYQKALYASEDSLSYLKITIL